MKSQRLGSRCISRPPTKPYSNPGNEIDYFTPTVGRAWPSGTFGCVRSGGWQMHEGLDSSAPSAMPAANRPIR
ncbi:MAG: hypothetical protein CM1200mP29_11830 [Verrucomicrobiota bacterium]|nr:MAG: hypothetical protein CM1200mP29_11830 [Verrucomicrobiota bacterium]